MPKSIPVPQTHNYPCVDCFVSCDLSHGPLPIMSCIGIILQRRAKRLPTSVARCSWFTDRAVILQEATQTHPTRGSLQFDGKAFGPLTHGGCWRTQVIVQDLWCLVAWGVAIDGLFSRFVQVVYFQLHCMLRRSTTIRSNFWVLLWTLWFCPV